MRVGLLGGTFNPPHSGHIHNSELALKYLGLDAVWWLVTPGNPLKSKVGLPDVSTRMAACQSLIKDPRLIVSDLESQFGTNKTYDTLNRILTSFPDTEFVWLAGTEIAQEFHKWYRWQELITKIPYAFIGRPTFDRVVKNTVFHRHSGLSHFYPVKGGHPALKSSEIHWIFNDSRLPISSTLLRAQNGVFDSSGQKV